MPVYHRVYEAGHLQFITTSTYRRVRIFSSQAYCQLFAETLRDVRAKFPFRLVGWVLMPEHFHVLLQPLPAESTSQVVKDIKQRTAQAILEGLRAGEGAASCQALRFA